MMPLMWSHAIHHTIQHNHMRDMRGSYICLCRMRFHMFIGGYRYGNGVWYVPIPVLVVSSSVPLVIAIHHNHHKISIRIGMGTYNSDVVYDA
ncbi:hypothetical protein EON63_17300 [archaeon]|nr:MAG: hypothetical protein EON63_17300 [archaeon]